MHDDEFEPRLGRMARRGSEAGKRAALPQQGYEGGTPRRQVHGQDGPLRSQPERPRCEHRVLRSGGRHTAFRARRVIVKMRPVLLSGKGVGGARAHLRYIQRDGVTREGQPGELYSADKDVADGKGFLEQSSGDWHQFRFIVSVEDADQYQDLKPFVRRLMGQMEVDLGTRLEWVAIDHFNTGRPHTHVILRGKDDRGHDLVIAREYLTQGFRERASEIVSIDLGPRTQAEILRSQRNDLGQERFTGLDRRLVKAIGEDGLVRPVHHDGIEQSLRAGRLQTLGRMGLAREVSRGDWRLDAKLEPTLRRMGETHDIIRTVQRTMREKLPQRMAGDMAIHAPGIQRTAGRPDCRARSLGRACRPALCHSRWNRWPDALRRYRHPCRSPRREFHRAD